MSGSKPTSSSQSRIREERTEMRTDTQPVQRRDGHQETYPGWNESLLHLQVNHLQKVLKEQNALLSLINSELLLSPTFFSHWQVQTSQHPSDPLNPEDGADAFKESATEHTHSDFTSLKKRHSFPFKEEPEHNDLPSKLFGSRRNLPPNPDDRPIRPGLSEEQQTFEEFVEEHLKSDQANLACTPTRQVVKRKFLRKGEGMSRSVKGKNCLNGVIIMNMSSRQTEQNSKSTNPGKKHKQSVNSKMSQNGIRPTRNQLVDQRASVSEQPLLPEKHHGPKRSGNYNTRNQNHPCVLVKSTECFKKIDDRIVKVNANDSFVSSSQSSVASTCNFARTDVMVQSLALKASNCSSSSEDGLHSHHPYPRHNLRNKDPLDLSDADYASDGPSEIDEEQDFLKASSSSSSFSSDGSITNPSMKAEETDHSDFTPTSETDIERIPTVGLSRGDTIMDKSDVLLRNQHTEDHCEAQKLTQQILSLKKQLIQKECHWLKVHRLLQSRLAAVTRENQELHIKLRNYERSQTSTGSSVPQVGSHSTVKRLFWNQDRIITYRNATQKEIGIDKSVTSFFNGDVKHKLPDGAVMYYYCDAQTTHSTYPPGLEILHHPNNQIEMHHPDGTNETVFPDGAVKFLYHNGEEESIFADGTVVRISRYGEKMVKFTNGQKEIDTSLFKQRIYPDGTVKTVYKNKSKEKSD